MRKIVIQDKIFELAPSFHRAIVVARNAVITEFSPPLAACLQAIVSNQSGVLTLDHPNIAAWDAAHRSFGSNPNKFPPSIKSLVKRVSAIGSLPFLNTVVAIMNLISVKHITPCGGDDLDQVSGDLVLGVATGDERFTPLGSSNEAEKPEPGEVIYFDWTTRNVMCRRWNWRNGDRTKLTTTTKNVVMNIDCLPPFPEEKLFDIQTELACLLTEHCRAQVETNILHRMNREWELRT